MKLLYRLTVGGYHLLLLGASLFNAKARNWVRGRRNWREKLVRADLSSPLVWFHCASLGEFEQGRPVMELFKQRHPDWKLLITFYSPSGYTVCKDYELADLVMYLPQESASNVQDFLELAHPNLAVFVKYEFWFCYMEGLENRQIPMVFISSIFRENQVFFKGYGTWFLERLRAVKIFCVQDENSKKLLLRWGIGQVVVSGDTRFDRVLTTVEADESIDIMDSFRGDSKVLIFGSAWNRETEFALRFIQRMPEKWKVIIAPHEIDYESIGRIKRRLDKDVVCFTQMDTRDAAKSRVLILDTIGHLSRVYKYGDVAVVGGGFSDGIHNILEPLAFGLPVFFGPNHVKFWEAGAAIDSGIGFEVGHFDVFYSRFSRLVSDVEGLKEVKKKCKDFIQFHAGATLITSRMLNKIGQIITCGI